MATVVHLHHLLSSKQPPQPFLSPPTTTTKPFFLHHLNTHKKTPTTPLSSSPSRNGDNTPPPSKETGCPVPHDQQPINEYHNLSTSFPFSWAVTCTIVEYSSRLFVVGASFALFVGLPVAWFGSVGPETEPCKRVVAAVSSGVLLVSLAVLRMYLGWAYVGNRLLSATVEYEETGWYDGQIWVKTAEVLARDRLLGSYTVKPVLGRLKNTLVTLATLLFACVVLFTNGDGVQKSMSSKSEQSLVRAIPGVYNDESARSFEPDAFCGEPASDLDS